MLRSFSFLFALLACLSVLQSTSALSPDSFSRRRHHARVAFRKTSRSDPAPSTTHDTPSSLVARAELKPGREHLMCLSDSWTRVLSGQMLTNWWQSPEQCLDACAAKGYKFAGLQYGYQCFCGDSINRGGLLGTGLFAPKELPASRCAENICKDGSSSCGGFWAIDLYSLSSSVPGSASTVASSSTSSTGVSTTSTSSSVVALTASSGSPTMSFSKIVIPSISSLASSSMATMVSSSSSLAPASISSSSLSSAIVSTSTSSAATPASTTAWSNQGCVSDSGARSLTGYSEERLSSWTVKTCTDLCMSKGFAMAGIEVATECYCGNTLAPTTVQLPASACNWYCFDSPDICGGPWALSIFSNQPLSALLPGSSGPVTRTSTAAATTWTALPSTSVSSAVASSTTSVGTANPVPTSSVPSSSGSKAVYVHHMVGNTYPYTFDTWMSDIKMASAAGFDGFALNIGSDSWQWNQVASAYAAAAASGTGFKLFLSFDMTVLPCSSISHGSLLQAYITTYGHHPSQAYYNNAILASTFAGSDCTFGISGSWDVAWQEAFKTPLARSGYSVWFVPSVFSDSNQLGSIGAINGELNWNSGWPMGSTDLDFSSDTQYMNSLGPSKSYMAAVSPGFYTHYGVNSWNKNWIFRSDDWLFAYRWEALIANRDKIDLIEALTWNDYGESSYIGPIEGAQPNSQGWVDGYDHTPLLAVNSYYSQAFKTGVYPTITTDRVYLTARTHPKWATATNDWVPRPNHAEWTDDNFYALVFATSPCIVTLSSSSSSISTTAVNAGVTRLSLPLTVGGGMTVKMTRDGVDVVDFTPQGYQFVANPPIYNFNYQYYASS